MKRLSDQTLYELLEVPVDAPAGEIERAYERARSLYGPGSLATYTLMSPDEAALMQSRIEEAKQVLLDADARGRYDERIGVRPRLATPAVPAATPWPAAPAQMALAEAALPGPEPEPGVVGASPIPHQEPLAAAAEAREEPPAPSPQVGPPPDPMAEAAAPVAAPPAPPPLPIQLKHEFTAPKDLLVPEGSAWTGEMLRQVREARGLTVPQVSERTKVTRYHIENIEADRFQALPAPVYLRGILMSLARELRLDGQRVARSYLERAAAGLTTGPGGRR